MAEFISEMDTSTTSVASLYGGAITCSLPSQRVDISEVRQVPDHQEVFAHPNTDQSIMIELLEYQNVASGEEAVRVHYQEISQANKSSETVILSHEAVDTNGIDIENCDSCHYLSGTQKVAKFNESMEVSNLVRIHLVLYRLHTYGTDLIAVFNDPVAVSEGSSSEKGGEGGKWELDQFKEVIKSLRIVDTTLFNA